MKRPPERWTCKLILLGWISTLPFILYPLYGQQPSKSSRSQLPAEPPPGLTPAHPQERVRDPEAEKILRKASQKFRNFSSIQAKFTIRLDIPETEEDEVRSGSLYATRDMRFRLEYDGLLIVGDGQARWQYLPETEEIQVSRYSREDSLLFDVPRLFERLLKEFDYVLEGEKQVRDRTVYVISFVPVNKQQDIFKIRLYLDRNDLIPVYAVIFKKSGVRYEITIDEFLEDIPLPGGLFWFNPSAYPGATVIDLRE